MLAALFAALALATQQASGSPQFQAVVINELPSDDGAPEPLRPIGTSAATVMQVGQQSGALPAGVSV